MSWIQCIRSSRLRLLVVAFAVALVPCAQVCVRACVRVYAVIFGLSSKD